MRDAFGGAFMIRLFLVFIFIYMFFTAIALNYAKAFKVKNKVIDYLEDNEVITISNMNAKQFQNMSDYFENEILGTLNYRLPRDEMSCNNTSSEVYCDNGIKITQIDAKSTKSDNLGTYYRVETYFTWSIPFLKQLMALSNNRPDGDTARGIWRISGETKTIIKR